MTATRRARGGTLQRGLRYTHPLADVTGHDAIEATIAAVQAQFPGSVFRLTGPVDAHHDQVRCEIGGLAVGTAAAPTGPGLRCRARCSAAVA